MRASTKCFFFFYYTLCSLYEPGGSYVPMRVCYIVWWVNAFKIHFLPRARQPNRKTAAKLKTKKKNEKWRRIGQYRLTIISCSVGHPSLQDLPVSALWKSGTCKQNTIGYTRRVYVSNNYNTPYGDILQNYKTYGENDIFFVSFNPKIVTNIYKRFSLFLFSIENGATTITRRGCNLNE